MQRALPITATKLFNQSEACKTRNNRRTWLTRVFSWLPRGCVFSRSCHRWHIFPRLSPVASFPAIDTDVFPRLAQVVCFPALGAGCMFSRAWHHLHAFPHLGVGRVGQVLCFPARGTGCVFLFQVNVLIRSLC